MALPFQVDNNSLVLKAYFCSKNIGLYYDTFCCDLPKLHRASFPSDATGTAVLCGPIFRVIFTVTQNFMVPVIALGLVPIEPTSRTLGGLLGIVTSSQWVEVGFDIIGHCLWNGSLNMHITILLKTSVQF